jgi:hypothetical protein
MRLCDEYMKRMALNPLFLRHSSKSFLFFESGAKLLSIKWINTPDAGVYEFVECILGSVVKPLKKDRVDWSSYEHFLNSWLRNNREFVFEESRVFSLVWNFFVIRNDLSLSKNKNPYLVYQSLNDLNLAKKIADESSFWNGKFGDILKNYAYWLKDGQCQKV